MDYLWLFPERRFFHVRSDHYFGFLQDDHPGHPSDLFPHPGRNRGLLVHVFVIDHESLLIRRCHV